jgi:hypothetical protein
VLGVLGDLGENGREVVAGLSRPEGGCHRA